MSERLGCPSRPWLWERAAEDPHKTALLFEGQRFSFAELAESASLTAGRLRALGAGSGDRVLVLLRAGPRYVELLHAIQALGAVAVLLNTRLSIDELRILAAKARPSLLVYDRACGDDAFAIAASQPRLAAVEIDTELGTSPASSLVIPPRLDESRPCCVIFSSGTSGTAKGVVLTNANHRGSAAASSANLGVYDNDLWLNSLPLYHVSGLSIVFRAVLDGVPMLLHPRFHASAVNHAIDAQGVTLLSLVPAMLDAIVSARGGRPVEGPLRAVLLGGSSVSPALFARGLSLGLPLLPTYGLTETSSQVATASPTTGSGEPASVGRALPGYELRIDDPDPNGRGEILIRGPGVMSGYLDDDAETDLALRDGWLRTGDIGLLDTEGCLRIDDRRTDLIVCGGENVYPAEVERVLEAHPSLKEAGVFGVTDAQWGHVVAAKVVIREDSHCDRDELEAWCRSRLAAYKVPRTIEFVDSLPRSGSGKLLRRLLRDH
ncbi:MAG: o-succinylbenzoate--CoA ligase [Candidatus Binatia bacterium]